MGISTDAMLFFGFLLTAEEMDEFVIRWGIDLEDDVVFLADEHYARQRGLSSESMEDEPCGLDAHCSASSPEYFAYVKASQTVALRGQPEQVSSLAVDIAWPAQLQAYCQVMGLPFKEPAWWLASYWSQ